MAHFFCDSSAIVKRYVRETGTAWVAGITSPTAGSTIYLARITGVEVVSAITRRLRRGALTAADAQQALYNFRADLPGDFAFVEITPALVAAAMSLSERQGLRGYDALNAAAQAEGLAVDNPNAHP